MIDRREIPPSTSNPLDSSLLLFEGEERVRNEGGEEKEISLGLFYLGDRSQTLVGTKQRYRWRDVKRVDTPLSHKAFPPGISRDGKVRAELLFRRKYHDGYSPRGKICRRPAGSPGFQRDRRLSHGCETTKIELAGTRGCCFSTRKNSVQSALYYCAPLSLFYTKTSPPTRVFSTFFSFSTSVR